MDAEQVDQAAGLDIFQHQRRAPHRDPLPGQRSAHGQLRQVEALPRVQFAHIRLHPCRLQPVAPFLERLRAVPRAHVVQQPGALQVLGRAQTGMRGQEGGARHWQQPFIQEQPGLEVVIAAQVEAHGRVDAITHHPGAVQRVEFAVDAQPHLGVITEKIAQPRGQPAHGKRWCAAQCNGAGFARLA